jgi:hypothetical protein
MAEKKDKTHPLTPGTAASILAGMSTSGALMGGAIHDLRLSKRKLVEEKAKSKVERRARQLNFRKFHIKQHLKNQNAEHELRHKFDLPVNSDAHYKKVTRLEKALHRARRMDSKGPNRTALNTAQEATHAMGKKLLKHVGVGAAASGSLGLAAMAVGAHRYNKRHKEKKAMMDGFFDELEKISSAQNLEKTAILGTMALGAGLHMGANTLYKHLVRNTHAGHDFEASQAATGYRHGLAGQEVNPVARNVVTYGVGPESMVNYDLGQQLGKQYGDMPKGKRYRQLKKLRKNVAMSKHVQHAPMGNVIVPAVNKILGDKTSVLDRIPTVAAGTNTLGHRAASAALGVAAATQIPHAWMHMGINAGRNALGRSTYGKNFMQDQLADGMRDGPIHPAIGTATDYVVSPAALDTRRMGSALRAEGMLDRNRAGRIGASIGGQVRELPAVRAHEMAARRGAASHRGGMPDPGTVARLLNTPHGQRLMRFYRRLRRR